VCEHCGGDGYSPGRAGESRGDRPAVSARQGTDHSDAGQSPGQHHESSPSFFGALLLLPQFPLDFLHFLLELAKPGPNLALAILPRLVGHIHLS